MTPRELRDLRTGRAHSQRQLAAVLGVAGNTVARWERGERPIPRWVDQVLASWQELAVCQNELERPRSPTRAQRDSSGCAHDRPVRNRI